MVDFIDNINIGDLYTENYLKNKGLILSPSFNRIYSAFYRADLDSYSPNVKRYGIDDESAVFEIIPVSKVTSYLISDTYDDLVNDYPPSQYDGYLAYVKTTTGSWNPFKTKHEKGWYQSNGTIWDVSSSVLAMRAWEDYISYDKDQLVIGSDGIIFKSIVNSNLNNNPNNDDGSNWAIYQSPIKIESPEYSANITLNDNDLDKIWQIDESGGNVLITIPDTSTLNNGRKLIFSKNTTGFNIINIQTTSGQVIGESGLTIQKIGAIGKGFTIVSHHAENKWDIIQDSRFGNANTGLLTEGKKIVYTHTIDGIDISFLNADSSINSVTTLFDTSNLQIGEYLEVIGSTSNDGTYTIATVATNKITVNESIINESAGASVSIYTQKIDVDTCKIGFLNNYTDPENPVWITGVFPGATAVDVTYVNTAPGSHVNIKDDGSLVQTLNIIDDGAIRDYAMVGTLIHTAGTVVTDANTFSTHSSYNPALLCVDFFNVWGNKPFNYRGTISYYPNSTDLSFRRSSGIAFYPGIDIKANPKNPNLLSLPNQLVSIYQMVYRNGVGGWNYVPITDGLIRPTYYDDGTGGSGDPLLPNGTVLFNQWTVMYFYNELTRGLEDEDKSLHLVLMGQQTFISKALAKDSLGQFLTDSALSSVPIWGALVVRGGGTDLSDTGDAEFIPANLDGSFGGGGIGSLASPQSLLSLTDTEPSYENKANNLLKVNSTETGVVFSPVQVDDNGNLIIPSTDGNINGALNFTNESDQIRMQFTNFGTDNLGLYFDCYIEGGTVYSSDVGSNFRWAKLEDRLRFSSSTGNLPNDPITDFTEDLQIWATTKRIGIGYVGGPFAKVHISDDAVILGDSRYQQVITDETPLAAGIGGGMAFGGLYTATLYTIWAGIWSEKENATSGQYGGELVLGTRTHGTGSITEALRISSTQDVSVTNGDFSVTSGDISADTGSVLANISVTVDRDNGSAILNSRTYLNSTIGSLIRATKARGTIASPSIVQNGDYLGTLEFRGYDGTTAVSGAQIRALVDGTPGISDMPGRLSFLTTPNGAFIPIERMTIDSNGDIDIIDGNLDINEGNLDVHGYFNNINQSLDVSKAWFKTYRNSSYGSEFSFVKSRSDTIGVNTVTQNGDKIAVIDFYGVDANNNSDWCASIRCVQDGTALTTGVPTRFEFLTCDSTGDPTSAMDIYNNGDIKFRSGSALQFVDPENSSSIIELTGSDAGYPDTGLTIRCLSNPSDEDSIFRVLSSGGSERLRVEHNGVVYTTNNLEVAGNGDSSIAGNLEVGGEHSYTSNTSITTGTYNSLSVTGISVINANTAGGNITLNGFANGVAGQIIYVYKSTSANSLIINNNSGSATQGIITKGGSTVTLTTYGLVILYCSGTLWRSNL